MEQRLFIIMGVAGCGKTSIGQGVAKALKASFFDGDEFHPAANIEKMARGTPLNDEDRWPWLKIIGQKMSANSGLTFVGCSALKKAYRSFLVEQAGEPICFVYLDGSRELIGSRMAARQGHFMPTSLLDSQFATLEVPDQTENHMSIDIAKSQDEVVAEIVAKVTAQGARH